MSRVSAVPMQDPATRPAPTAGAVVHLRLLFTSDLHAHLMPWDYLADRPKAHGLTLIAPLIHQARAEVANCLLFDNGDFLQGSALGDWHERQGDPAAPHPVVLAMNALGYDAGGLGNHEFSHGLPFLTRALAGARFPVVSANLTRSDGSPLVPDHVLLCRSVTDTDGNTHSLRIAVTGFAPPQTARWEGKKLHGSLHAQDILTSATETLSRIAQARPDLTIALAHTGIAEAEARADMENAALPLAALAGIDALVTGHTHQTFPGDGFAALPGLVDPVAGSLHGKPAVMPGFHGSHLGVIDLTLRQGPQGWHVTGHHVTLRPVGAPETADPALTAKVALAHAGTTDWLRRPIGHTATALHTHFSLIAPCAALRLIARAQAEHLRPLIPAALRHLPLLSAVAPFRTGGRGGPDNVTEIAAGAILERHATSLYPHPNTPILLELSGAEVADWLERSAVIFHRVPPKAQDAPLIRNDVPGFDFDQIEGLTFRIDLAQPPRFDPRGLPETPAARRITDLRHAGRPVRPADRFLLATNSYRVGSASFPGTHRPPVAQASTPIRDFLAAHITAHSADLAPMVWPAAAPAWGFLPQPGTTVIFDACTGVTPYLHQIASFAPFPLGPTDRGFLRFRLSL